MAVERKLKLVPFDPNDYSIGKVLLKDSRQQVLSKSEVDAALSLFFQWPEYSVAVVRTDSQSVAAECELHYDREERHPTELWIKLKDPERRNDFAQARALVVRFEIFKTCYEFAAEKLADSQGDPRFDVAIAPPDEMLIYKGRRLPRFRVPPSLAGSLVSKWTTPTGETLAVEVVELGLSSTRVVVKTPLQEKEGLLSINGTVVNCRVVRREDSSLVLSLEFRDSRNYKEFFDLYASLVFPNLKRRGQVLSRDVIQLYEETGYLGKFYEKRMAEESLQALVSVWQTLDSCYEHSADYVAVDDSNALVGASSCVRAFDDGDKQVWAFHQLCARATPDLLEASGSLYSWRAEYLAGRPEDLKVIGWFDSRSRWLERIYVKFVQYAESPETLFPVDVRRVKLDIAKADPIECKTYSFGHLKRFVSRKGTSFGGVGPRFLNASNVLDALIVLQESGVRPLAEEHFLALASASGSPNLCLEVTSLKTGDGSKWAEGELVASSDRFFCFQKNKMADFLASVEHSLAVTKKKKASLGETSVP